MNTYSISCRLIFHCIYFGKVLLIITCGIIAITTPAGIWAAYIAIGFIHTKYSANLISRIITGTTTTKTWIFYILARIVKSKNKLPIHSRRFIGLHVICFECWSLLRQRLTFSRLHLIQFHFISNIAPIKAFRWLAALWRNYWFDEHMLGFFCFS